ncbi:MAG: hypothetical protein HYW89_00200 [Candidatus Sungiibacteriota bacterium]|uniref:Uncharacterized protein n=1 Tax=Candidatus Sungiibacteriota bacterium TaxID=2750080 RepID=A0A7T5RJL1_9BACT|nr:MAG: hypothetical protein HYW89_00200 [Candidatus Sungbacteria bacterium]
MLRVSQELMTLRERIIANHQMVEELSKQERDFRKELQEKCPHQLIIHNPGHFGYYDPVVDYDDTRPEVRICVVCGKTEAGKRIIVSGKEYWDFKLLIAQPLSNANHPIRTVEEEELIHDFLRFNSDERIRVIQESFARLGVWKPLSEIEEKLRGAGYSI